MDVRSLARPYAKAAFAYAKSHHQLANWSFALSALAGGIANAQVRVALANPQMDTHKLLSALTDIVDHYFVDKAALTNFVKLLIERQRLTLLPTMFHLFEEYRAIDEKTMEACVYSVYPLSIAQQTQLAAALKIRFQREVTIRFKQDDTIIGGVVIQVGDQVIDGSVKNTLKNLLTEITV